MCPLQPRAVYPLHGACADARSLASTHSPNGTPSVQFLRLEVLRLPGLEPEDLRFGVRDLLGKRRGLAGIIALFLGPSQLLTETLDPLVKRVYFLLELLIHGLTARRGGRALQRKFLNLS